MVTIHQFAFARAQCVRLDAVRAYGHVLSPGRYVEAEAADETPFASLQEQLEAQFSGAEELTATIQARLARVGL